MRRKEKPGLEVPEHLYRFRPDDWSVDHDEAASLWLAARFEWLREHRDEVNGVDFINQGRDERRKVMFGIEPEPPLLPSRRRR